MGLWSQLREGKKYNALLAKVEAGKLRGLTKKEIQLETQEAKALKELLDSLKAYRAEEVKDIEKPIEVIAAWNQNLWQLLKVIRNITGNIKNEVAEMGDIKIQNFKKNMTKKMQEINNSFNKLKKIEGDEMFTLASEEKVGKEFELIKISLTTLKGTKNYKKVLNAFNKVAKIESKLVDRAGEIYFLLGECEIFLHPTGINDKIRLATAKARDNMSKRIAVKIRGNI